MRRESGTKFSRITGREPRITNHQSQVTGHYLIASGFTGDATAPVTGNAGATNMNS
jgi:hypothetical protein